MATTLSLHRNGYFLLETDDEKLAEHLTLHKKMEIVSASSTSVKVRTQSRNTKRGSRLNQQDSGGYMSTLRAPSGTRLEPFGKAEVSVTFEDPGCVVFELPAERPALTVVHRKAKKAEPVATPVPDDRPRLKDLIALVNSYKREMGDDLVLWVNEEGELRATLEY